MRRSLFPLSFVSFFKILFEGLLKSKGHDIDFLRKKKKTTTYLNKTLRIFRFYHIISLAILKICIFVNIY